VLEGIYNVFRNKLREYMGNKLIKTGAVGINTEVVEFGDEDEMYVEIDEGDLEEDEESDGTEDEEEGKESDGEEEGEESDEAPGISDNHKVRAVEKRPLKVRDYVVYQDEKKNVKGIVTYELDNDKYTIVVGKNQPKTNIPEQKLQTLCHQAECAYELARAIHQKVNIVINTSKNMTPEERQTYLLPVVVFVLKFVDTTNNGIDHTINQYNSKLKNAASLGKPIAKQLRKLGEAVVNLNLADAVKSIPKAIYKGLKVYNKVTER